jgi:hypothetical protein
MPQHRAFPYHILAKRLQALQLRDYACRLWFASVGGWIQSNTSSANDFVLKKLRPVCPKGSTHATWSYGEENNSPLSDEDNSVTSKLNVCCRLFYNVLYRLTQHTECVTLKLICLFTITSRFDHYFSHHQMNNIIYLYGPIFTISIYLQDINIIYWIIKL